MSTILQSCGIIMIICLYWKFEFLKRKNPTTIICDTPQKIVWKVKFSKPGNNFWHWKILKLNSTYIPPSPTHLRSPWVSLLTHFTKIQQILHKFELLRLMFMMISLVNNSANVTQVQISCCFFCLFCFVFIEKKSKKNFHKISLITLQLFVKRFPDSDLTQKENEINILKIQIINTLKITQNFFFYHYQ